MSYRRSHSPSPHYRQRSPSPRRYSRSPSPRYRRYSRSPSPRYRRYSRSPSPRYRRRSPPRRRRSPRVFGTDRERRESNCLFVGNLPYHFRERETAEYFERCGRLRTVVVGINKRTGQSKGYAFVEYEDRRDAEEAFQRFQGFTLEGRKLRLDWDVGIDKKGRPPSGGDRYRRTPPRSPNPRRYSPVRRSPSPRSPLDPKRGESPTENRRSASPTKSPISPRKRSRSPIDGGDGADKRQKTDENPL